MRRLWLTAALAALVALPASAVAARHADHHPGPKHPVPVAAGPGAIDDPAGVLPNDDANGAPPQTTDKALHAQGRGEFIYRGSGGTTIALRRFGIVRVTDNSTGAPLTQTATGIGRRRTFGKTTVYMGRGTLALDGSAYRVDAFSARFLADVDPTAANRAVGIAHAFGRGFTIIKGGVPVRFARSHRILLTHGPLAVNVSGRAFWRVGGPANGTVDMTISNRVRVWDYSAGKDAVVAGTNPEKTRALPDGSTLYWGLRDAHVTITGTAFRMRVHSTDVEGTFTPALGSLARSGVRGFGTITTGPPEAPELSVNARQGNVTRILLQP
jgi:hypothetical protein